MGIFLFIVGVILFFSWINSGSSSSKTTSRPNNYSKPTYPNSFPAPKSIIEDEAKLKKKLQWENDYNALQKAKEEERKKELQKQLRYRTDWQEFKNILSANNISTIYHFTDISNIQSIRRHGALYSWHYCLKNNIEIPVPGGTELSRSLDTRYGVQNYVRTSFTRSHPMMFVSQKNGKIKNPVILEIDPEVIYWKNSKYANKNATRNDVNIGSNLEDFKNIRFPIVKLKDHFDLSEEDKPFYQAEILTLEKIPVEFIRNINRI